MLSRRVEWKYLGAFLLCLLTPLIFVHANSIWSIDDSPASTAFDANPNELGTKFVSSVDGYITALRFYKAVGSTGGEVGRLWTEAGAELASATFEPATSTAGSAGWRTAILNPPVAITADQTYIVSYNTVNVASNYYYGYSNNYFTGATTTNGFLTAFNTQVSANGVFNTVAGVFPDQTFQGNSYFTDVVFVEDLNETDPPEVAETNITNNQTDVSPYTNLTIRFNEIIATSSIAGATITFTDSEATPISYSVSYDPGRYELIITPQDTLLGGDTFTFTLEQSGGLQDLAGNELADDVSLTFTTDEGQNCPCTIWKTEDLPERMVGDVGSVELGTKFESKSDGFITAVRFYKNLDSKGGEIGRLWTEGGVELASTTIVATSSNPGVPGWYEARFSSPVAITADTTYVVSYSTADTDGSHYYVGTLSYFVGNTVSSGALTAYANETESNGVFANSAGVFPTNSLGASYFADVVFTEDLNETFLPSVRLANPADNDSDVSIHKTIQLTFNEAIATSTVDGATITLEDADSNPVAIDVSYNSNTYELSIDPTEVLLGDTDYTLTIDRAGGFTDIAGNLLAEDYVLTFTTEPVLLPGEGGPILLLYSETDGFSQYYNEILRAEGFTSFSQQEIANLSSSMLNSYSTVVVGAIDVSPTQAALLADWVTAGGNLILMRPDTDLRSLAGVTVSGTQSEGYLYIATTTEAGAGLVDETIQYHGVADLYTTVTGDTIASLYQSSTTPAGVPAVTVRSVGSDGGQVATFAFDVARSIIYSRQGNPDNAGIDVNADGVPRPNDLFHPDYVDLSKVAIPQADELQRLFANLIITMSEDVMPIPRFWYLPHMYKVAIMMTIDDHNPDSGDTEVYFDTLQASSTDGCSLDDWECYRATVWTYISNNAISDAEAVSYQAEGFEFGVHVRGPVPCQLYSLDIYRTTYAQQMFSFRQFYPSLPNQLTHRYHCIVWSDWSDQVEVMYENDVRLDMNYYYWPSSWILNRPGYFTGSGFPMRYANIDGFAHNVYQSPTQLVNENGLTYPDKAQEMIDLALGSEGYYGILGTHGDVREDGFEGFMLDLAYENDIPLVTAEQVLDWTDARNESTYGSMDYSLGTLSFTLDADTNADGLMVMLPTDVDGESLVEIRKDDSAYSYATETIKGIEYALFAGVDGDYEVEYTYTPPPESSDTSTGNTGTLVGVREAKLEAEKEVSVVKKITDCLVATNATSTASTEQDLKIAIVTCMQLNDIITPEMAAQLRLKLAEPVFAGYRFTRMLRYGMSGEDVEMLQRFYNSFGFLVATSGPGSPGEESQYFGPATEQATKTFQQMYAEEILQPWGLTSPTGIFSTYSIQKANQLLAI